MSLTTLQHVMSEIGPLLELAEVVEYPEQSLWSFTIDGETVIFAEYDEEARQLTLSADAGEMPVEGREKLLDLLMRCNGRWDETGGVWFSLDATGEVVQQAATLPASDLTARELHTALINFLDILGNWRLKLRGQEDTGAAAGAAEAAVEPVDFEPPVMGVRI